MSSYHTENGRGDHTKIECPKCGDVTKKPPAAHQQQYVQPMNRETVTHAIDRLRAQGEWYIKTDDVAEVVDEEVTRGKKGHIGRILNSLAEERPDIEQWSQDRRSMTWRINGGENA